MGVIGSGIFSVILLDVNLPLAYWIVMPLTVWIIYTIDHLIDGYKNKEKASIRRHQFHYKNRKALIILVALALIITAYTAFTYLSVPLIRFGIFLGIGIAAYLLAIFLIRNKQWVIFQKEIFIGVFYTLGIWGGPLSALSFNIDYYQLIIIISFLFLAWADMVIYAIYEFVSDENDQHSSFPRMFGIRRSNSFIHILLSIIVLINMTLILFAPNLKYCIAASIMIVMSFLLFLILHFNKSFEKYERYRLLGEFAFAFPAIILILE